MEFRIATEELRKALYRAQGIVERKATMPILANVLVNAGKAGLQVTAFDLDIGIVSEHPAEVLKSGALTLSAKYIFDIVQNLPEAFVTVKRLPNNYADISSGSAHFKIVGMAAEEYPKLPKEENATLVEVNGSLLLEMIKKTSFAISNDETRYILNGVFFEPKGAGKVRMVATDGLFKKSCLTMVMRLIDGQFPEYQRVIPEQCERVVRLHKVRFLEALKRISLLSADKSNAIKVTLASNVLRVSSNNPDLGEAQDELPVEFSGTEITVGFNARYLMDVLTVVEGDEVAFELGDEHSPGVLHPPDDRSYIAVVMPMRV